MPMPDIVEIRAIMNKLRGRHVASPRNDLFLRHFNRLLDCGDDGQLCHVPMRFTDAWETRGVMVVDGAGGGKTTMIKRALERHPAMQGAEGEAAHYITARVPTPATFKGMGTALLRSSGYVQITNDLPAWQIWDRLRLRLRNLGVTVLWIDEAHDLFGADRDLILRSLKALMQGDDALIVILSGTERLDEIVRSDPQLLRRLSIQNLAPVSAAADEANFQAIMNEYCRLAGVHPPRNPDLVARIFHASRYKFGRSIETIINAIEIALEEGASGLTIKHFITLYGMKEGCSPAENIFHARNWMLIDPDRTALPEPAKKKRVKSA